MSTEKIEKVIETSVIRLSADETRSIMHEAQSDKPVNDYRSRNLADLGIMQKVRLRTGSDISNKLSALWSKMDTAVKKRDRNAISNIANQLYDCEKTSTHEGFVLTPLGKQIARGIRVQLSAQYIKR